MGIDMLDDAALEGANVLNSSAPVLDDDEVRALLHDMYGIEGDITPLTSERDKNYHVLASDGRDILLKITNAAEPVEITRFQTGALLQIAKACPSLPVPRIVPTRTGEHLRIVDLPGQGASVVRMLTYLHGEPLHRTTRSVAQRRSIAICLATLDLALKEAAPPSIPHELQWDIKNAAKLRSKVEALSNPAERARAARVIDEFDSDVAPLLPRLRKQVVHNDFNPHNILVAPDDSTRVTGILDFGDMVETPLIVDLATACAYQVAPAAHPLETIGEFVSAYHGVCPLEPDEFAVLFGLIKARLATTIIITSWRARRYPDNRVYITRNTGPAWAALEALENVGSAEARGYLLHACKIG
jgi:hydroxylysine kinase